VLTEGADSGEVALRDLAPQLPQAAGVLGGEDVWRDTAWRRLDGRRGHREREGAGCGECEGPELHAHACIAAGENEIRIEGARLTQRHELSGFFRS
jgi:hypothetical protein